MCCSPRVVSGRGFLLSERLYELVEGSSEGLTWGSGRSCSLIGLLMSGSWRLLRGSSRSSGDEGSGEGGWRYGGVRARGDAGPRLPTLHEGGAEGGDDGGDDDLREGGGVSDCPARGVKGLIVLEPLCTLKRGLDSLKVCRRS